MKIAFIHNEKKLGTGAHYINDLISLKLRQRGVSVKHFYPSSNLMDTPAELKGLSNILFFYSLLEHREQILKCDLIQGTTYTPLTYLAYDIPVIAHFGSTTNGFLDRVPLAYKVNQSTRQFWYDLQKNKVLKQINLKTKRPLRDIADIEKFVASRATKVIATSKGVARELAQFKVEKANLSIIPNAIEDYWFAVGYRKPSRHASLVFLGRMGNDSFNLKLKGMDRLFEWYSQFPGLPKKTVAITTNEALTGYLDSHLSNHTMIANAQKDSIPSILNELSGSILFIPSRYEGFSLSLIEGMSQGLIPIVYKVGVAPEIIKNGKNGFLVTNQRQVHKYTKLLLSNYGLRKKMSLEAHKTSQIFTTDRMVDQFISLYEEVLTEKKRRGWIVSSFLSSWKRKH
jgi:glycosyltransferase involved in cell wall biosynthesis